MFKIRTKTVTSFLINTAMVCTSAFIGLLVLEVAYRYWTDIPLDRFENFVDAKLDLIAVNSSVVVHDPLLGWNLKSDFGAPGTTFMTGKFGIRMNENTRTEPATGGVLAVGDSFTAGSGVDNAESWPAQLEKMVDMPVVNAGSGAWATDQIVLRAESLIPDLKPSTIIVSMLAQDNLRNSYDLYGGGYKPWFAIEGENLVLKGTPVPRVSERPIPHRPFRAIFGRFWLVHSIFMRLAPLWWASSTLGYHQVMENQIGITVSCKLMERLSKLSSSRGIRVIAMTQYGGQESLGDEPPWYGEQVHQCAISAGLDVVDTFKPLHEVAKNDPKTFNEFWIDEGGQLGHMSAKGNRFIAELIMKTQFSGKSN